LLACFDKDTLKSFTPDAIKAKELSFLPLTVFINPEVKVLDHRKVTFEESCGSVMGFSADVSRCHSIEVTFYDEKGEKKTEKFSGWNARIIQHENDHLNGVIKLLILF
jgi:peptide deformylase